MDGRANVKCRTMKFREDSIGGISMALGLAITFYIWFQKHNPLKKPIWKGCMTFRKRQTVETVKISVGIKVEGAVRDE